MQQDTVAVTAELVAKEGYEARAAELLAALAGGTAHHTGVLRYEVQRQADAPRRFMVVERWSSLAALQAHLDTEDMRRFLDVAPEVFEGPGEVRLWQAVAVAAVVA